MFAVALLAVVAVIAMVAWVADRSRDDAERRRRRDAAAVRRDLDRYRRGEGTR
jgi:type II secretory pathway pseudopilin PulG